MMAKQKGTHGPQRALSRKRSAKTERDAPPFGVEVPEALQEAIDNERSTLAKAESILRCLKISLTFDADERVQRPYYPDIAEIACNLLRQALNGLDEVNLSNAVMKHNSPASRSRRSPRSR